jgi:hypothetical protein
VNNVRDLQTMAQALADLTPENAKCLSLDPIEEFLPSTTDTSDLSGSLPAEKLDVKIRRQKSQRLTQQDEAEVRSALVRNHGNVKATETETGVNERTIRRLAEKWRVGGQTDKGRGSE